MLYNRDKSQSFCFSNKQNHTGQFLALCVTKVMLLFGMSKFLACKYLYKIIFIIKNL